MNATPAARRSILKGAIAMAALAACNPTSGTVIIERGPPTVMITGTVLSASGSPAVGASVHSRVFKSDCTTAIFAERDTLVRADSAGRFKGYVYVGPGTLPQNQNGCVRAWATSSIGGSTSDTNSAQVVFGAGIDTATFHFVLP